MNGKNIKSDARLVELMSQLPDMIDFHCAVNLCSMLQQCERVPGDVVEFGCYNGKTAALLTCLTEKQVWLYDSFQGLPENGPHDITREDFRRGHLTIDRGEVVQYFKACDIRQPRIVGKWFKDVTPEELPQDIAFAHIDGDMYQSIYDALTLVYPRLSFGGACLIHDYGAEILQGVKPAVDTFLAALPYHTRPTKAFISSTRQPGQFCIIR